MTTPKPHPDGPMAAIAAGIDAINTCLSQIREMRKDHLAAEHELKAVEDRLGRIERHVGSRS